MQKIFTDQTLLMVTHIKNLLSQAGIESELRNEFAAGGTGELSFIDTRPELWVAFEDASRAKAVIEQYYAAQSGPDWQCSCGETNSASFETCWRCGRDKSAY